QFFDLITLSQVIEHIPDPLQLLLSLKDKLKSNGKIILSCPNANALNRRILGRRWLHWHVPYHLNHFTKTSIGLLLRQAGLEIISIRTITPNLWSVLQLRSLLTSPEEGCRDTSWDLAKNGSNQERQKTILECISLKAINISFRKNGIVFAPYNRIVDALGLGESLLVKACMAG
ncbi:MAG: class I SAM-dependent methyltransferase, partial [Actinomycetota bacterium]|nr:class I SAM-dependent methyltransferase [Actinomycetota bacterium]